MAKVSTIFCLSGLLLSTACGDSSGGGTGGVGGGTVDKALEIRGVVRPDSDCTYSTNLDLALSEASWDLSSASDYVVALVVENTLESRVDPQGEFDVNDIELRLVEVTLLRSDGTQLDLEPLPNPYRVSAPGVVRTAHGQQPSLHLLGVKAVPVGFADSLRASGSGELTAQLQIIGSFPDGTRVRSPALLWPIRLCDDCLAEACTRPGTPDGSCTPGQDGDPWCRL